MQKKCIRVLVNIKKTDSCRPHFIEHQILTLPSLYILETALFVRRNMTLFKLKKDTQSTRQLRTKYVYDIKLPQSTMQMYRNGPYYSAIKIYNNLPETIKSENEYKTFYSKLKKYLIEKCFYSVNEFMNDK